MSPPAEPVDSPAVTILLFGGTSGDLALAQPAIEATVPGAAIEAPRTMAEYSAACARSDSWSAIVLAWDQLDDTAWSALELARQLRPTVPVVVLADAQDEAAVVAAMRRGAADFVARARATRLGPALLRALAAYRPEGLAHPLSLVGAGDPSSLYRLIAENSRDLICLHDLDRRVTFISPSVRPLLGYEPDECVGLQPRELIHPDDLARLAGPLARIGTLSGRSAPMLLRVRHARGHFIWMETLVEPIAGPDGHPVQLMSVSRDFSERQRAEEAMQRGEHLFEGIAEANRLLLTSPHVTEVLSPVLRSLGEAARADRVLVFEYRRQARTLHSVRSLRAEWVAEEPLSVFSDSRLADVPLNELGAGSPFARLAAAQTVECTVDLLPEAEREFWQEHGLLSLLAFPLLANGRAWGAITFEQCRDCREWTVAERSALRTASVNLGQAIERETTLDALALSERRYESLLAGLSEGVFQIDLEARWRFLNPTWEELTGHPVDQCLGRRFSDFVGMEDATRALEGFGRLLSGRVGQVESEVRFLHRSGRELWMLLTARPQTDETGRVTGVSGTLVDVTQRRLAQAALGASERKFAAVFASSSDALFLVDSESDLIAECNPRASELFECTHAGEMVGTSAAALLARPAVPAETAKRRSSLARGEAWVREEECMTRRGRRFWGQVAIVRMAHEVLGTALVRITDISEMKRAEERLRASLAEKEVLLKEVYHRVKNNLQIISALLRMQTRRVSDRTALAALENSISRVMAMSMVHEKLYQAQNLVSIDFLSFAQSLVGFLNQLTIGGRSEINIEVSGVPLALSIDQAIPLGLVLNELVTNSLKYAFPDGLSGHVVIHIGTDGPQTARVTVSDDGIGLPVHVDVDNASGLGFRIVRMLVEQLHGSLDLESRGGLRAIVRMPFNPAAAGEERAS